MRLPTDEYDVSETEPYSIIIKTELALVKGSNIDQLVAMSSRGPRYSDN